MVAEKLVLIPAEATRRTATQSLTSHNLKVLIQIQQVKFEAIESEQFKKMLLDIYNEL